jgi:hypothetical protein
MGRRGTGSVWARTSRTRRRRQKIMSTSERATWRVEGQGVRGWKEKEQTVAVETQTLHTRIEEWGRDKEEEEATAAGAAAEFRFFSIFVYFVLT